MLHPRRVRPRQIEDGIQFEIVDLLKANAIDGLVFFHPANGGKRDMNTARRLKGLGVIPGIPDLVIVHPDTGRVFWMEVKSPTGSLSKDQRIFRDGCRDRKQPWAVVRSRDQAQDVLTEWGLLRITNWKRREAA